ncbi:toll-like receptor 1 [Bufo bufo]|uniref:toll-like receptor 1 n=1 Tax=Bufo bufo TaxID=8384 RepID=UPI001ABE7A6C|nr:toll-like receptor 1 [Bufo bufo]XP_040274922.1 toll-like receptor 1 [Bufo bufo]
MSDKHHRFWMNFLLPYTLMGSIIGEECSLPYRLSLFGTKLDLSHCNVTRLQPSIFQTYPYVNVQILDLSYNALEELDFSVFQHHTFLQQLDISHNKLRTINCSTLKYIRGITHLNMSYNFFKTTFLCKEFAILTKLRHLGLSVTRIDRNNFMNIAHQQLDTVFLGFEHLEQYESGSLQLLNTEKLHVVLPQTLTDSTLLYNDFNISTKLEISNILCEATCDLTVSDISMIIQKSKVSKLILSNITMPWREMAKILQICWRSTVEHLFIYRFTLIKEFNYEYIDFSKGSLKSLTFENIIPLVFLYSSSIHPLFIFSQMSVENLTISDAEITHFSCPPSLSIFQSLILTNNRIVDGIFTGCKTLTNIQFLNLQNNILERLSFITSMTSTMNTLKHLDVSGNRLYSDFNAICEWSQSLHFLNLSRNKITDSIFNCLPTNLEVLDLSRNQLSSVKDINHLKSLKELYLSSNQLSHIPDCSYISKNLIHLNIDENLIHSPSKEQLTKCQNVKQIVSGKNKYQCNCELKAFISTAEILHENLIGWPQSFMCEYPEEFKDVILKDFHPSEISCNVFILVGLIVGTMVVLLIVMFFLCRYFDLPWYIRMIFQWLRRKYRIKRIKNDETMVDKRFHAFISYSHEDYEWVKNALIPNLEKGDNSIKLCHHERHFMPGKTIVENIINCIERSFKSIFVLSPNFIQSEWCHYELYFAQHSLFGKKSDNLILILLDPIPQYLIPNKYSKLKAIMKHRSYTEWPKEKGKHGLFWANLREAIQANIPLEDEEVFVFN